MKNKFGFYSFDIDEFTDWIKLKKIGRTITKIQLHHTYIPDYKNFTGVNHFELQQAMKNHHINSNGWGDIGQHYTVFPDGLILTGREIERTPACIYGQNSGSVCIENLGNFDKGKDLMSKEQRKSILLLTALLCNKFNIPVTTDFVVYHHWFDLVTGVRNNGTKNNKSCPGTAFFGGNKVKDCDENFIPAVKKEFSLNIKKSLKDVLEFVCVNATTLNVRIKPNSNANRDKDTPVVIRGSILRIYDKKEGWLKISSTREMWVAERFTILVQRAVVKSTILNIRSGPGTNYSISGKLTKNEIVFIESNSDGWVKIAMEHKWVNNKYLAIEK